MEELSDTQKQTVNRARRVQRYLSQAFFVAEKFTGNAGVYVKLEDTVRDFGDILAGKYDDKPEDWFYMVKGTLSQKLAEESGKKPAAAEKPAQKEAK